MFVRAVFLGTLVVTEYSHIKTSPSRRFQPQPHGDPNPFTIRRRCKPIPHFNMESHLMNLWLLALAAAFAILVFRLRGRAATKDGRRQPIEFEVLYDPEGETELTENKSGNSSAYIVECVIPSHA